MRPRHATRRAEEGQVTLLVLGFTLVAIMLIIGTVIVTTVQIARVRLYAVADAAALDASDTIDLGAYDAGLPDAIPVASKGVNAAASSYLAAAQRPDQISSWSLLPGTGSPDGQSAVVVLRGSVELPFVGGVFSSFGKTFDVTVESRAEAALGP